MSDNWKPGDLALCVRGGRISTMLVPLPEYPKTGRIYTVSGVDAILFASGKERPALWFTDAPRNTLDRVWAAHRFLKVTPPADMKIIEEKEPIKETAYG